MREFRQAAMPCVKQWVSDPKRALAILDLLAAEWRRFPKQYGTFYVALEDDKPPRLLRLETSVDHYERQAPSPWSQQSWETGFIAIYVAHSKTRLSVTTRCYPKVTPGTRGTPSPLFDPRKAA